MKILIPLAVAFAIAACDSTKGVSPSEVALDRTYVLQACDQSASTGTAGCGIFGSGSTSEYADSGRVVFNLDHTAVWTSWVTRDVNGCYLSGGSCHTISKSTDVYAGSYLVATDGITLTLGLGGSADATTLKFTAGIPERVDAAWTGPDSLSTYYPRGNFYMLQLRFK